MTMLPKMDMQKTLSKILQEKSFKTFHEITMVLKIKTKFSSCGHYTTLDPTQIWLKISKKKFTGTQCDTWWAIMHQTKLFFLFLIGTQQFHWQFNHQLLETQLRSQRLIQNEDKFSPLFVPLQAVFLMGLSLAIGKATSCYKISPPGGFHMFLEQYIGTSFNLHYYTANILIVRGFTCVH